MILRDPWMLLLLLLVPLCVWLRHRPARRLSMPFSDGGTLARLPATWGVRVHRALPALYGTGLALLIVALARPQKGLDESRVQVEAVDIVLVLDVSTSMRAEDFSTATKRMNRLDAVKGVVEEFIKTRRDDRLGLITFAALPYTLAPLTLDQGWLLQRLQDARIGMVEDGTAIGTALSSAVNRLRRSEAKSKVVVLLTDGMNNRGRITPENAAQAAKALKIKVYTIGAGTRGMAPVTVSDPVFGDLVMQQPVEIDEARLKRIAEITGAQYFRATDLRSLADVYRQIDAMEKTEMEMDRFTRYEERFMPWAAAGLLLLALERLLALSRFGGLPS